MYSEIPSYHECLSQLAERLRETGHLALVLIDASELSRVEHDYGSRAFEQVLADGELAEGPVLVWQSAHAHAGLGRLLGLYRQYPGMSQECRMAIQAKPNSAKIAMMATAIIAGTTEREWKVAGTRAIMMRIGPR